LQALVQDSGFYDNTDDLCRAYREAFLGLVQNALLEGQMDVAEQLIENYSHLQLPASSALVKDQDGEEAFNTMIAMLTEAKREWNKHARNTRRIMAMAEARLSH